MKTTNEIRSAFDQIYRNNVWGIGSGTGSLPGMNINYMHFLSNFLKWNEIRSVLDFGCGDWQFSRYLCWDGIDYTGVDVVPSLIEQNNIKFGSDNIRFVSYERAGDLPSVDLIVSKDVMQHLPVGNIVEYVAEFKKKSKFVLLTNDIYPDDWLNVDIEPGACRSLRLTKEPFYFDASVIFRDAFVSHGVFVEKEACIIKGDLD